MTTEAKKTSVSCPVCGEAELQASIRTEQFEYDADGGKLSVTAENVPVESCPACGEVFSGPEAGRIRTEAIRRALGLMTSAEIRSLRTRLGLSQSEFARLTGIGEASISRWERGQLIQSRAFDRYLRLLSEFPENRRFLTRLASGESIAASGETEPSRTGRFQCLTDAEAEQMRAKQFPVIGTRPTASERLEPVENR